MFRGKPVVLLCGDGGSGKDEVARALADAWHLGYKTSTSFVAAEKMWPQVRTGHFDPGQRAARSLVCPYRAMEHYILAPNLFQDLRDFYDQRAKYRRFWADWIDCYNEASETKAELYLNSCQAGNHLLTGIRKCKELDAFYATSIPDLSIWVHRPGTPRDPTQEYGPEACDIFFNNDRDLIGMQSRVRTLGAFIGLMARHLTE